MTIKKSLISVSAAALLVAGMTGCSSSSSSNSSGTQPTSIKVVDGEVINAQASVKYLDDKNVTQTIAIDSVKNFMSIAPERKAGSSTYDISEVNSTVLANMVGVTFAGQSTFSKNSVTYATTFMDANGDGEFNTTSGDTLGATAYIAAPAGFTVATPISTLVYSLVDPEVTANNMDEANRTALVEQALSDVAKALNLTAADIKTVDPLSVIDTKPEYALLTALIGASTNNATATEVRGIANTLKAQTAAKTPSEALANMATADTKNATMFTSLSDQLKADADMIKDVKNWNLDSVRENKGQITYLTSSAADFNVTSLKYGDQNVSSLVSHGAKVNNGDTVKIKLAVDGNVSTKKIGLLISYANPRSAMEDKAGVQTLTAYLPLEINATNGVLDAHIKPSDSISYEGIKYDSSTKISEVVGADKNITSIDTGLTAGDVLVSKLSNTLEINASKLLSAIDSNVSKLGKGCFNVQSNIAKLQIALVDTDKSVQRTENDKTTYWGTRTITSSAGKIAKKGYQIINLNDDKSIADMRGDATGANMKPVIAGASVSTSTIMTSTTSAIDFNATSINTETNERNTTLAASLLAKNADGNKTVDFMDLNTTAFEKVSASGSDKVDVAAAFKLKTTAATALASAATGRFPQATYTFIAEDEFGAKSSSGDANVTFTFDREPVGVSGSRSVSLDSNKSSIANFLLDPDASGVLRNITDWNITVVTDNNMTTKYFKNDANTSNDFNVTSNDLNWTMRLDYNITGKSLSISVTDVNTSGKTIADIKTGKLNLEVNATDGNNTYNKDVNITFN